MDCPLYTSSTGERKGELEPYQCPIIYCPPTSMYGESKGNITFSICVKYVDDVNPENKQFIDKTCESSYHVCGSNCDRLKGEYSWVNIPVYNHNYTTHYAIACQEGDYSTVQNKSTIFAPSSLKMGEKAANPPTASSSYQTQTSFMIPLILVFILVVNFLNRKF